MPPRDLSNHLWDSSGQITSTGSANAYVIGITEELNGYFQGMPPIRFKANFTNTGSATANIVTQSAPAGMGAKTLKKGGGASNLESGDIVSGGIYTLSYDGTNLQVLELADRVTSIGSGFLRIGDIQIAWGNYTSDNSGPPPTPPTTTFGAAFNNTNYGLTLTPLSSDVTLPRFSRVVTKAAGSFTAQTYTSADVVTYSAIGGSYVAVGTWQ